MKKRARIQLGGKMVTVQKSQRPLTKLFGYYDGKKIVLSSELNESEELRIFLHEALHALFYYLDEEVVDAASKELAEALEQLELA